MNKLNFSGDYDSAFEEDHPKKRVCRDPVIHTKPTSSKHSSGFPQKQVLRDEESCNTRKRFGIRWQSLNAYERHKQLINQYVLYHPGATSLLQRDASRDKTDFDILNENHKFLWNDDDPVDSWGKELAKKYYDKLFKEYCICDLTMFKVNKIGMRWRMEKEVISGKGQFSCCNKRCSNADNLRSWEMNFAYAEHGEKKNCLVKLRLCHDCSYKLNYCKQRKELTKSKSKRKRQSKSNSSNKFADNEHTCQEIPEVIDKTENSDEDNVWKAPVEDKNEKSREDEFEEYLNDLFL